MVQETSHGASQHEEKPSKQPSPAASGPLADFEAWLYDLLVFKAPFQLPKAVKEWLVAYGPWVALVAGVVASVATISGLIAALSFTGYVASSFGGIYLDSYVNHFGLVFYLSIAVLAVQLVIMFVSIPMLLKKQRKGWVLAFYSGIISLAYSLINTFSYGFFSFGSLLMGLIGAIIGFYVIFQIRSYYKK